MGKMPGDEKIIQDPGTEKLGLEVRARISRGRMRMLAGAPSSGLRGDSVQLLTFLSLVT